nr:M protein, serotype 5 like [Tanacetum cinerariifolium]
MSITFQNLIHRHHPNTLSPNFKTHIPTSPNFHLTINPLFKTLTLIPLNSTPHRNPSIKSLNSDNISYEQHNAVDNSFNLDDILSVVEFVSLTSSVILSVGFVVNSMYSKAGLGWFGGRVMMWQPVLLVFGIVIGVVIRRRQWGRVSFGVGRPGSRNGVNLVERIEKVEEDVRNSAAIIRVLSRQLEKLGIRFRVTRKSLKEPIAQTAELAQKNSEATRALAMQEDNLEKELAEIQKVLLAMQDQQSKQLELILAIAKSGKLLDNKPVPTQNHKKTQTSNLEESSSKVIFPLLLTAEELVIFAFSLRKDRTDPAAEALSDGLWPT